MIQLASLFIVAFTTWGLDDDNGGEVSEGLTLADSDGLSSRRLKQGIVRLSLAYESNDNNIKCFGTGGKLSAPCHRKKQRRIPAMPFSDVYSDVTAPACESGCEKPLSLQGLKVGRHALRLQYGCLVCYRECLLVVNHHPGAEQDPVTLPDGLLDLDLTYFPGSESCEWCPSIVKVEAGSRFLCLHFHCGVCAQRLQRYFDIEARGYVLMQAPKRAPIDRCRQIPGWGSYRGQRRHTEDCCVFYTSPSDWQIGGHVKSEV